MGVGRASVAAALAAGLVGTIGCEVREVRRRRPPPPPPPERVVYVEPAPPPPVEVIPVSPGPEYIYVRGGYYRDHDRWVWRHGDYRRRY